MHIHFGNAKRGVITSLHQPKNRKAAAIRSLHKFNSINESFSDPLGMLNDLNGAIRNNFLKSIRCTNKYRYYHNQDTFFKQTASHPRWLISIKFLRATYCREPYALENVN